MFALEIQSGSQEAAMLIRRPRVLLGPDERSHVVLPANSSEEIEIIRSLGRGFSLIRKNLQVRANNSLGISSLGAVVGGDQAVKTEFRGSCSVELNGLALKVIALDLDLLVMADEPLDRAGIRLMRRAAALPFNQQDRASEVYSGKGRAGQDYPALMIRQEGAQSLMLSMPPQYSIVAGRGKQCDIRLDAPDVSATHVRLTFDAGKFWAEDLGSTNGTFIGSQQVSGRVALSSGSDLRLGRSTLIRFIADGAGNAERNASERSVSDLGSGRASSSGFSGAFKRNSGQNSGPAYTQVSSDSLTSGAIIVSPVPCVIAASKLARPARITVTKGVAVTIGRDPSCDMWIGAPHVSRRHCAVLFGLDGKLSISDSSSNGTVVNGELLRSGETKVVKSGPADLEIGGGIRVGFCITDAQLREFEQEKGSFAKKLPASQITPNNDFRWLKDFFSGYAAALHGHNTILRGAVWAATGVLIAVLIIMGHLLVESFR